MSARQLSLSALPVACPMATRRAVREKRLQQIMRTIKKAAGDDDFWDDHLSTFEIATRVQRPFRETAAGLSLLRWRGVLLSRVATFDDSEPGVRTTCWYIDDSPRPRPYGRRSLPS